MMIQIVGTNCPNCRAFYQRVKDLASDLKLDAEPEYLEDFSKIIALGAHSSPALVIDGQLVMAGYGHSDEDIKRALRSQVVENKSVVNQVEPCSICHGI